MDGVDYAMMGLALDEAVKGDTAPNPRVGAVVANEDQVIATGFHTRAGEPHAEVNALRAARERAKGATLYCTLEPCNHHGRTPPCTQAIVRAGIRRVVISARDPKKHGDLAGVEFLRAQGIDVEVGVREAEGAELIADFSTLATLGRPLVRAKAAITLDGKIATTSGDSKWITSIEARTHAHRLRAQADAVLIGIETAIADDPQLTVRLVEGRDPLRVVLDSRLRLSPKSNLAREGTTVIHAESEDGPVARTLLDLGVRLVRVQRTSRGLSLKESLSVLGQYNVMHALVEGGGRVLGSFFEEGLVDRVSLLMAPKILGPGRSFCELPEKSRIQDAIQLEQMRLRALGPDVLIEAKVTGGAS